MTVAIDIAILQEKVRELKEEIKEMKEWSRNNFRSLYDKSNNKSNPNGKKSFLGSLIKIGS